MDGGEGVLEFGFEGGEERGKRGGGGEKRGGEVEGDFAEDVGFGVTELEIWRYWNPLERDYR